MHDGDWCGIYPVLYIGAEIVELSEAGDGSVFLDEVFCDGSEMTLLECVENAAPIRAHSCSHFNDVAISCQG